MISIILPYWDRQAALDRSLASLAQHYADLPMEVVIVDDGSPQEAEVEDYAFPVTVVRMNDKPGPLNPCVPFNVGAKHATGEVLVLSNPETVHPSRILPMMLEDLQELGPDGYVMAAAWCPEMKEWHCHSSVTTAKDQGIPQPVGSGLHFCSMLTRELWNKTGGFDEDYREGAGYEDNDFVLRLERAGAKFALRDDLVVHHHKEGARTHWVNGQHARNRAMFFSKWAPC